MTKTRKANVHVGQDEILAGLSQVGPSRLDDIADHFGVSEASARRKLDGAIAQGRATLMPGTGTRSGAFRCGVKAEYAALDAAGKVELGELQA